MTGWCSLSKAYCLSPATSTKKLANPDTFCLKRKLFAGETLTDATCTRYNPWGNPYANFYLHDAPFFELGLDDVLVTNCACVSRWSYS